MRRVSSLGSVVFLGLSVAVATQENNLDRAFFAGPLNLSHNPTNTLPFGTRLALDAEGNLNVVWADSSCADTYPYACTSHLFFRRSVNGGTTFSAPKDISRHSNGEAVFAPQIAVDRRGIISVVWEDDAAGGWEIFYSRSVDGGARFSVPKVISNYAGAAIDPQLVVDRLGRINVVWQTQGANSSDWNVWFTRSVDLGRTFSDPQALCDSAEICNSPKIAVEPGGGVDVVWAQALCADCEYDVFFSRSSDIGAGFSTPQNLSASAEPLVTTPELVVDGRGNIQVVWSKGYFTPGPVNVFLSRSSDRGRTFVSRSLSRDQGRSYFPEMGVDADGNINVFWLDDVLGGIFFSRSVDGGTRFSTPKRVSSAPRSFSAIYRYVAVESRGNLNLVWEDGATGSLFFRRSTDGGATFSRPQDIANSSSAFFPQIAADASGNINVLWFDEATGSLDILFARGVTIDSLRNDIASLPESALKSRSVRAAMLNELADAAQFLARGDSASAIDQLERLRRHLDGCGTSPGNNDWIIDCTAQFKIRGSIDIIRANLRFS